MAVIVRSVFLSCIVMLAYGCAAQRDTSERQIGIRAKADVEITAGYETYTFFLSPSRDYALDVTAEAVRQLENRFDDFGEDIGDNNLAILPVNIRGGIDVYRSKELTDTIASLYPDLSLSYNDGPFIVVLNHHPDDHTSEGRVAVSMSFSGVSPERIVEGMNFIEEGIRRKQVFDKNYEFYEAWLDIKSWLDGVDVVELKDFVIEVIKAIS